MDRIPELSFKFGEPGRPDVRPGNQHQITGFGKDFLVQSKDFPQQPLGPVPCNGIPNPFGGDDAHATEGTGPVGPWPEI